MPPDGFAPSTANAFPSCLCRKSRRVDMGSFGPSTFIQCFYCEYQVENPYLFDGYSGAYALCPWCGDYLIEQGGEPNDVAHWWATWRRQHNLFSRVVTRCVPGFGEEIRESILGVLVGSQPRP